MGGGGAAANLGGGKEGVHLLHRDWLLDLQHTRFKHNQRRPTKTNTEGGTPTVFGGATWISGDYMR
jgi:hypothetical protein